jgi:N-succinyldiaminopimelate aminotransferase
LWKDEKHVEINRALYKEKFKTADEVFSQVASYSSPLGGFFLWLEVEDGEAAAKNLWRKSGVRVLPGSYLSRDTSNGNPGKKFIRVALVEPINDIKRGLHLIKEILYN